MPPASESAPGRVVTVLFVSPIEADHVWLQNLFSHSKWVLYTAHTLASAMAFLHQHQVPIILCDCELPIGTWKDLLEHMNGLPEPPLLIVTSGLADDALWAEALNLGAYDVLAKPFDKEEVLRVVALAWLHWKANRTN